MRMGDLGKAEECFREAVSVDPKYKEGILSLSCLLLNNGTFTDSAFLEQSEVLAQELDTENGTTWALLSLIYRCIKVNLRYSVMSFSFRTPAIIQPIYGADFKLVVFF